MSYNDWDPEDLLNFEYDRPRPQEIPQHKPMPREIPSEEDAMRKAAQEAAYLRYRQEYADKKPPKQIKEDRKASRRAEKAEAKAAAKAAKRERKAARKSRSKAPTSSYAAGVTNTAAKASKLYKFSKFLSIPYVVLFAAFTIVMTIMDILPFWMMVALYIVLGLLSLIIVIQLTKDNVKKWAKVFSTILACLLIFFYGVGTAYALGTLSFLSTTSVANDSRVSKITKEPFNVMMTGLDVYGVIDTQGRSDVNMIVTVNPNTEQVLLTSVPRDYEVRMPDKGYATDKLTHTGFYSVDCTKQALEDLLQTKINYYVKVNFSTVHVFINALGGIDVVSPETFNPVKMPNWTVKKGLNHMNGKQALAFARERKAFMAGDNERVKNQQLVFEALLKKATSSKSMLLAYSNIISDMKINFEMSFSSRELRSLIKMQFARGINWDIYKNTLTGSGATKGTYTTGSQGVYVTEQDPTSVANAQELIQAVMDGKKLAKDTETDTVYVRTDTEGQTE